jgi:hypothetical protein
MWQRRAALRDEHARVWWPETHLSYLMTRGGFVETVTSSSEDLAALSSMLEREPIMELVLYGMELDIPKAWRARMRSLVLCAAGEAEEMIALLRMCPRLEAFALRSVELAAHPVPLGTALPECTKLSLAGQPIGAGAATLLAWSHLAKLEELDLSGCQIDGKTLEAILDRGLPKLRVLRLSRNRLGDGARWVLSRHLATLPALRYLELVDNGITDDDAAAIAKLRPDVELVVEYLRPERYAIDLLGAHLEFVARALPGWSIEVNGRMTRISTTFAGA